MRVLVIKQSSLGDVIHTLPALSDAQKAQPDIRFDWVVEEAFAEVPSWHKAVNRVLPIALRRWRKSGWFKAKTRQEMKTFIHTLRQQTYDAIIDTQGLLKSAIVTRIAKGHSHGYDKQSIRAKGISWLYETTHSVARVQHAIDRNRQLFAQALNYPAPSGHAHYDLTYQPHENQPYVFFLHGTSWANKCYPETYWQTLCQLAIDANYQVQLPAGNPDEHARAKRLAAANPDHILALPQGLPLSEIRDRLAGAVGVISVDTGLGHLATALNRPTIGLYGPTDPSLSGMKGEDQISLMSDFPCAPCLKRKCSYQGNDRPVEPPCFSRLGPEMVWERLIHRV